MQEITGDLFAQEEADAICITTNGVVGKQGAIMGAGCALEAKKRWPSLPTLLETYLAHGNFAWVLTLVDGHGIHIPELDADELASFELPSNRPPCPRYDVPYHIVSFPTKQHWLDRSDLGLIRRSAQQLVELADVHKWKSVILPRPGCGLGGLSWEDEVRPLLSEILDDRFRVITFGA